MPGQISATSVPDLLSAYTESTQEAVNLDSIQLDFKDAHWIDVMGLCLLSHWFERLEGAGVRIELLNMSIAIEGYMWRMDLLTQYNNLVYTDRCSQRGRNDQSCNLVEVCAVTDATIADETALRMAETIISKIAQISDSPDPEGMKPSPAEQASAGLSYVFSELLDNSLTHGRRSGYSESHPKVAIQYVRTRGKISIAILDNGCGLLNTLCGHSQLLEASDIAAVRLALQPRISCNRELGITSDSINQGIGLTVSTQLASKTGGNFTVFSGDGYYNERTAWMHPSGIKMPNRWQGTGVYLEFNVSDIDGLVPSDVIAELPGYREEPRIRFI